MVVHGTVDRNEYRLRADSARLLAHRTSDWMARQMLLDLADEYEELAVFMDEVAAVPRAARQRRDGPVNA